MNGVGEDAQKIVLVLHSMLGLVWCAAGGWWWPGTALATQLKVLSNEPTPHRPCCYYDGLA